MSCNNSYCYKNPYYFIQEARKLLLSGGYVELKEEEEEWNDFSINKFFVVRNDSSIVAVNKHDTSSALIVTTHDDSPCLKLKPNTKLNRFGYDQVRIAPYGNPKLPTWRDRELIYIGKVITKPVQLDNSNSDKLKIKIVAASGGCAVIPSLAKHLTAHQRQYNDELHYQPIDVMKGHSYKNQSGQLMRDLASLSLVTPVYNELTKDMKDEEKPKVEDFIVDWDLSLIPLEPTRKIGTGGDMISGYAVSILASAIPAISTFVKAKDPERGMNVVAIFDNYQITGNTRTGSRSPFLKSVLERIGCNRNTWANSRLINIDNFAASKEISAGDGLFVHSEMNRTASMNLDFKSQILFLAKRNRIPLTPMYSTKNFSNSIAQDLEIQMNIESTIIGIPIINLNTARELAFNDDVACVWKLLEDFYSQYRLIPGIKDI